MILKMNKNIKLYINFIINLYIVMFKLKFKIMKLSYYNKNLY